MKLWKKDGELDPLIERFTVGDDTLLDRRLVRYDCRASRAHAEMLASIGVLDARELEEIARELDEIARLDAEGAFPLEASDEDCHTAIERHLTERLGEMGKKIHTARSRNDQVLTALRLFEKDALDSIASAAKALGAQLRGAVARYGDIELPGYTHMRKAMPTTVATWLGCYTAALDDDIAELEHVRARIDLSPLGTAAGFGVPLLPIDRGMTARALGFAGIIENPIFAQHGRGKLEAAILSTCVGIAYDLNRLASDLILFSMPELGYVALPESLCTGSSIMPHKRNPDVLELIRAKYHVIAAEESKVRSLGADLITGYSRDLQLTKAPLFAGLDATEASLLAMERVIGCVEIDGAACRAGLTEELYTAAGAYELVLRGVPFREAYRIVGKTISYKTAMRGGAQRP